MSDSAQWDDRLRQLRDNRTSGATDLALEAIDLAAEWIAQGRDPRTLAAELQAMHPAIATVRNVGRMVAEEVTDETGNLPARLGQLRRSLVEGNRLLAEELKPLIPSGSTVITLSNSSTARDALIALRTGCVYVLESLPGGEGKSMVEALREGLGGSAKIELIPDAAMGNVVPSVDCALVGIDTFDDTGAIVHKVGTLPLALCCRHFAKPFYAAGHHLKRTEQVLDDSSDAGKPVESRLFDRTPAELITQLVTA